MVNDLALINKWLTLVNGIHIVQNNVIVADQFTNFWWLNEQSSNQMKKLNSENENALKLNVNENIFAFKDAYETLQSETLVLESQYQD